MLLYVSGPITGVLAMNVPAFREAQSVLQGAGFYVVVPADVGPHRGNATWEGHMRADIRAMLDCDGVATLPGWQKSKGASLEVHVATAVGIPVFPVKGWVFDAEGWRRDAEAEEAKVIADTAAQDRARRLHQKMPT